MPPLCLPMHGPGGCLEAHPFLQEICRANGEYLVRRKSSKKDEAGIRLLVLLDPFYIFKQHIVLLNQAVDNVLSILQTHRVSFHDKLRVK